METAVMKASKEFVGFQQSLSTYSEKINNFVIHDEASANQYRLDLKNLSIIIETIEEKRKLYVKPLNDEVSQINDFAKKLKGEAEIAIKDGRAQLTKWQVEQERIEKENRERLRKEAEEKKKKLEEKDTSEIFLKQELLDHCIISLEAISSVDTYPELAEEFAKGVKNFDWSKYESLKKQSEMVQNMIKSACTLRKDFVKSEKPTEQMIEKERENIKIIAENIKKMKEHRTKISSKIEEVMEDAKEISNIVTEMKISEKKVSGTLIKRWTFEVTDKDAIPREFLEINDKLVKNVIAKNLSGSKQEENTELIPGIRFYKVANSRL